MRPANIVFAVAGAILVVAGALAPADWMACFGAGMIVGAITGPFCDAAADWERR
jgi:hypothetical protein